MFESKTQIQGGDYHCVDISGRAYLWTPPGTKPNKLIITAHGILGTSNAFTLNFDATVNFYSNHGNSVEDPGLKKFYEGKAIPKETLHKGDVCYNYILSKYTNSRRNTSHNKATESYDSINDMMGTDYGQQAMDILKILANVGAGMGPNSRADQRANAFRMLNIKPASILTIRNRRLKADVNLEWVLNQLQSKGYQFDRIDCLFCRNTLWTGLVGSMPFGGDYSDAVAFG